MIMLKFFTGAVFKAICTTLDFGFRFANLAAKQGRLAGLGKNAQVWIYMYANVGNV